MEHRPSMLFERSTSIAWLLNGSKILDSNNVAPALRSVCVSLALVDREHDYSMFKPEVARAIPELKQANAQTFHLRDELLTRLGDGELANLLVTQPRIDGSSESRV